MKELRTIYESENIDDIINLFSKPFSIHELYSAYFSCRKNKRNKNDAIEFELNFNQNLMELHREIKSKKYKPLPCKMFVVKKPQPREVWMAQFRDRVVHHLIYNRMEKIVHTHTMKGVCACIPGRGTHYGVNIAKNIISKNQKGKYLKCDIKAFFPSIDKNMMFSLLYPLLKKDSEIYKLIYSIIFQDIRKDAKVDKRYLYLVPKHKSAFFVPYNKLLPIGNLTSQFFANLYLHTLDVMICNLVGENNYIRYADDIIIFGYSEAQLNYVYQRISEFLKEKLLLDLHPDKKKMGLNHQGVSCLGYFVKPFKVHIERKTASRIIQNIGDIAKEKEDSFDIESKIKDYNGFLSQAKTNSFRRYLVNTFSDLSPKTVDNPLKN